MIYNFQLTSIYLITIGLIYYHSIFLYKNVMIATLYSFNEKILWNKYIERPRILVHLISLVLIWIVFSGNETSNTFQSTFKLIIYLGALLLLIFSYKNTFINTIDTIDTNKNKKKITTSKIITTNLEVKSITDLLLNKKWFRGNNIDTNISNLLNYKLEEIEKKSIICSFGEQIQIGKILFQLKDFGLFNEYQLKDIYNSDIIITSKGESIKNSYSFHKFQLKNKLYNNNEINLKKYF